MSTSVKSILSTFYSGQSLKTLHVFIMKSKTIRNSPMTWRPSLAKFKILKTNFFTLRLVITLQNVYTKNSNLCSGILFSCTKSFAWHHFSRLNKSLRLTASSCTWLWSAITLDQACTLWRKRKNIKISIETTMLFFLWLLILSFCAVFAMIVCTVKKCWPRSSSFRTLAYIWK